MFLGFIIIEGWCYLLYNLGRIHKPHWKSLLIVLLAARWRVGWWKRRQLSRSSLWFYFETNFSGIPSLIYSKIYFLSRICFEFLHDPPDLLPSFFLTPSGYKTIFQHPFHRSTSENIWLAAQTLSFLFVQSLLRFLKLFYRRWLITHSPRLRNF